MSGFEFDERAMERLVKEAGDKAVREIAAKAQPQLDALHRSHGGKPVSEVTPTLRAMASRLGWTLNDNDLRSYAEGHLGRSPGRSQAGPFVAPRLAPATRTHCC